MNFQHTFQKTNSTTSNKESCLKPSPWASTASARTKAQHLALLPSSRKPQERFPLGKWKEKQCLCIDNSEEQWATRKPAWANLFLYRLRIKYSQRTETQQNTSQSLNKQHWQKWEDSNSVHRTPLRKDRELEGPPSPSDTLFSWKPGSTELNRVKQTAVGITLKGNLLLLYIRLQHLISFAYYPSE